MSVTRPKFVDSPYFVIVEGEWSLKEGAPEEVQKEFDEFMQYYREQEEKGIYI